MDSIVAVKGFDERVHRVSAQIQEVSNLFLALSRLKGMQYLSLAATAEMAIRDARGERQILPDDPIFGLGLSGHYREQ